MADELTLRLKVETTGTDKKLEDVNQQLDKIKKNSKETADSFGLADTKIGKMWTSFKDGASKGIQAMSSLKGAVIATGIGALILSVTALVMYFTKTERGAEKLKVIMAALGQVVNTVTDTIIKAGETLAKIGGIIGKIVSGNKSLKDGFVEARDAIKSGAKDIGDAYSGMGDKIERAIVLAERENKMRKDLRQNMVDDAKLEVEIARLRENVSDATLEASDRIAMLNKQQELQNALYDDEVKFAREAYEIQKERNALSESTQDDLDKEAQLLAELIKVEAKRSDEARAIVKKRSSLIEEEQREIAKANEDRAKAAEDEAKRQEEITAIKNDAVLAAMEGQDKELKALQFKYEADVRAAEDDLEKKAALTERYVAEKAGIEKKYAEEKKKADEEAQAVIDKQREDDLKKAEEVELQKLEQHKKVQNLMLEGDMALNEYDYENKLISYQEYLDNEREIKLEQAELEIEDLEELNERKEQINAEYNQRELDAKKQLNQAITDGAIQIAQAGADAIFNAQASRLNAAKERELSNKNLTEEQKMAITKKYADKQKKMDMAQAIVNGALAIIKVFASMGPPVSFVMAGITAALTAIQVAQIAKTKYYALGGILQGKKHAEGGIYLGNGEYAEGGEGIISAANMRNPAIRESVIKLSTTTPAPQTQRALTADDIIAAVTGSIKAIPVQVTEKSISTAQKNVEVRDSRFIVA